VSRRARVWRVDDHGCRTRCWLLAADGFEVGWTRPPWRGLEDRSSRPRGSPRRTPAAVEQAVLRARRELRLGPHPLGWALGLAASTVHAILVRYGCSQLNPRQRAVVVRYERERPGELLHVDVKKLGRILRPGHRVTGDRTTSARGKAGWLYLFAAVDDATRLGFAGSIPRRRPTRRSPSSPPASASMQSAGS